MGSTTPRPNHYQMARSGVNLKLHTTVHSATNPWFLHPLHPLSPAPRLARGHWKPVQFRRSPHKARRAAHLQMLMREENTRVIVFPQTQVHPEPQSVTLFGNKVFADVIKMR